MNTLIQYIRHSRPKKHKGQLKGCVVATVNGVGWSLCRKGDVFNKKEAVKRAVERANNNDKTPVPKEASALVAQMAERRKRAAAYLSIPV